jgi:benzoyl-CoA reductase/2-hydroxyglutaryl-CoA dehydratase subunit BcrC/BadD/HgdB
VKLATTTPPTAHAARLAAARSASVSGQPVVGIVGAAVPAEAAMATGCFPLRLAADPNDLHADCTPMERAHEPEIRSLFRQAVCGTLATCDLLVIASTSDGYRYLFQYLSEMRRTGRGGNFPPLLLYDFLFGDTPAVTHYNRHVLQQLLQRLAILSGRSADDGQLLDAIRQVNLLRGTHARVLEARAMARITGVDALGWVAASIEQEPEAADRAADDLLATATRLAADPTRRLLVASGVPLYHTRLHALLESTGAIVTAENDEWGSRRFGPEIVVDDSPVDALIAHYRKHTASPRQLTAPRQDWLRTQLGSGRVDGLVLYAPPSDQFFGWECPELTSLANEHGIPALLLRQEALEPADHAATAAQIAPFLQALPRATHTAGLRS